MSFENLIPEALENEIGAKLFALWFGDKIKFEFHDSKLYVYSPSIFLCEWIRKNFSRSINSAVKTVSGRNFQTEYQVRSPEKANAASSGSTSGDQDRNESGSGKVRSGAKRQEEQTELNFSFSAEDERTESQETDLPQRRRGRASRVRTEEDPSFKEPQSKTESGERIGSSSEEPQKRERKKDISKETPLPDLVTRDGYNIAILPSAPKAAPSPNLEFASYESFVVGKSNRLARRAADFAIDDPGKINPIFIYGSTSVGKTHLLESICSELRMKNRRKQVLYLTAGKFTSLFVQSLKGDVKNFKNKFRNLSVLVIDDIHFLQGRKATQLELLNLIDTLKSQGVQMVFSADASLKEMKELRSEIVSRIESGLVCEIEAPERETLLTIFRRMATQRGLTVPEDVCRFVVSNFSSHARQLSGVLNRLHAAQISTGQQIDLEMTREVLSELLRGTRRSVSLQDIERVVIELFGISTSSLRSKSRAKVTCYPRMLAMWLARKYTNAALSEIGMYFGNRSHSTVLSAQKRVDHWLNDNVPFEQQNKTWYIADTLSRLENALTR